MANLLPNEKELYAQIERENINITPEIWDLLYNRLGDDISSINLLCEYYLANNETIPLPETKKIFNYTRHIKEIVNQITVINRDEFPFPEFSEGVPLHPVLREMFTHYIGNDVYMINLISYNSIDPLAPTPVPVEDIRKILLHTRSIKQFINKLREVTSGVMADRAQGSAPEYKNLTKEEIFLKIRSLLAEEFKLTDAEKINLNSHFQNDLGFDSVDAIRVTMVLEEGFDIEIPDQDTDGILTINQAVEYLFRKFQKKTDSLTI